jgi:GntR family transcriptional repressor for pyruvate dehydrogenase complex
VPVSFEWGLLLGEHQLQDTIEARMELEVMLAGLAAERCSEQDVQELGELLLGMRDAKDTGAFITADVAFHLRVAKAAQNSILEQMLVSIQSLLRSWITRVREAAMDHGPSYRDHVSIHAAIEKGDVAAARAAMLAHLTNAGERLKKTSFSYPVKR